ncbi:F-box/LRR-repeat protein 17 [Pyrus x bretschneideri]|uniref:F-box/LRR-repeat protein 17 n=1 Tax=Pyrus x bretschneideri TaxID=225117 RepID=UPI00202EC564|nr:F-box/LRR-repeat protein 17 [Pyrus x bretschneideri]
MFQNRRAKSRFYLPRLSDPLTRLLPLSIFLTSLSLSLPPLSLSLPLSLSAHLKSPKSKTMQHRHHHYSNQPHFSAALGPTTPFGSHVIVPSAGSESKRGKRRGSYTCGRCGQPKKGHICHLPANSTTDDSFVDEAPFPSLSDIRPPPPPRQPYSHLRRALSFDDDVDSSGGGGFDSPDLDEFGDSGDDIDLATGLGGLPASCLWEILKRLPPPGLLSAAMVCKGWRETTRRLWKAAEMLRIRVPTRAQVGFVGSVLQKCPGLVNLSLRMESDVDATLLAWITFSCPNLEFLEINTTGSAINRITGDELGRFVVDRRFLKSLKMEGCSNLGGFSLCSSSLSTIWLSGLYSLSKMAFNCPNLKEISVDFSHEENDNTDLVTMADVLARNCPRLQNIHIASIRLSNTVVLALTAAKLRGLRMLSLVFGSEITDASVAAIASSYQNLELLDLSGSSISDGGIGIICNVFPDTLSRLLVALCPNISSSFIQFATAQLPLLELLDCGMTICDPNSPSAETNVRELPQASNDKVHNSYQKLIIKHARLKKLSLWGCSGLDALYLNCRELNDLNLNYCKNLYPERLVLQCPNLENVHASGCQELLIGAIQSQVDNNAAADNQLPCKRLADGSKRVGVPHFLSAEQPSEDDKKRRKIERRQCSVLVL